jgi:hypothetical protein
LTVELFDFSDSLVFSHSMPSEVQPNERANLLFNIRLLKFPHAGRYKIRLRVDGKPVHNSDFLISQNAAVVLASYTNTAEAMMRNKSSSKQRRKPHEQLTEVGVKVKKALRRVLKAWQ